MGLTINPSSPGLIPRASRDRPSERAPRPEASRAWPTGSSKSESCAKARSSGSRRPRAEGGPPALSDAELEQVRFAAGRSGSSGQTFRLQTLRPEGQTFRLAFTKPAPEATAGIEPAMTVLQSSVWLCAHVRTCARRAQIAPFQTSAVRPYPLLYARLGVKLGVRPCARFLELTR